MHEYSIVASLLETVAAEAEARGARRIRKLFLRVGELAGVDVPLLRTAYETFAERSVCDGAELSITEVAAAWCCPSCERPIERGEPLRCLSCDSPAKLTRGDELFLDRIEMEVP